MWVCEVCVCVLTKMLHLSWKSSLTNQNLPNLLNHQALDHIHTYRVSSVVESFSPQNRLLEILKNPICEKNEGAVQF